MERESFIFYKSFYEALSDLNKDIKLEVLTAIIEYALFGELPDGLKPVAKALFTLMKPNIDVNNARFENGKKAAEFGKRGGRPKKRTSTPEPYTQTFEQEVELMRNDEQWRKTICEDFRITTDEYEKRLSRFLTQCNSDKERKGKEHHDSFADCQSHLRYWMTKAFRTPSINPADNPSTPLPDIADDFGAINYDND